MILVFITESTSSQKDPKSKFIYFFINFKKTHFFKQKKIERDHFYNIVTLPNQNNDDLLGPL